MAETKALVWDQVGEKIYETGIDRGVHYKMDENGAYPLGVAWNGLTAITESPGGGEETPLYANNSKYGSLYSKETFGGTIEAFTYPDSFAECDGSLMVAPGVIAGGQSRKPFGLCYRSLIGNDVKGDAYGYKLTLVYNAKVSPSEKANNTVNESPEAAAMSWEFTTTEVPVATKGPNGEDITPMSRLVIDSTKVDKTKLAELEAILYGSSSATAKLPTIDEVLELLSASA